MKLGAHGYADIAYSAVLPAAGRKPRRRFNWALAVPVIVMCLAAAAIYIVVAEYNAAALRHPVVAAAAPVLTDPAKLVATDPAELRPVSADVARKINAARPDDTLANPVAQPLIVPTKIADSFVRSVNCLASAVYYEAASESEDGQRAVAQVVLNRVRHPIFPKSVCGVVYQGSAKKTGCQFSFTCDGSEARVPSTLGWARAQRIAVQALAGFVYRPVGLSTFYHADYVAPYWAPSLVKVTTLGRHIFYRWGGSLGSPGEFVGRYSGIEPVIEHNVNAVPGEAVLAATPEAGAVPGSTVSVSARPVLGQAGSPTLPGQAGNTAAAAGSAAPSATAANDNAAAIPATRFVIGMGGAQAPAAPARTDAAAAPAKAPPRVEKKQP